jgi:hypothetical protein
MEDAAERGVQIQDEDQDAKGDPGLALGGQLFSHDLAL